MMPRPQRIVIPGWLHHVTQRGNHRQMVFFTRKDRYVYLELLSKFFTKYDARLIGYSLMGNHVHLAVIPEYEISLAKGIGQLHQDFSRWQNIQTSRVGHLWQNRFFSCPVEEDRIWDVLAYVEMNPVRAKLVRNAWDWEWSSARAHITGRDQSGLLDMAYWEKTFCGMEWKEFLKTKAAKDLSYDSVRKATSAGRFLGNDMTARWLETKLGRPILPRKRGPKQRKKVD
jgi:putative transposase